MATRSGEKGLRPTNSILRRTLILLIVCGILSFAVLIGRLYKVMITDHEKYERMAVEQQTRETSVSAFRGTIYDANGNVLAISSTAYNVFISPYEIEYNGEDKVLIATELSRILDVDPNSILEKMKDTKSWYKTIAVKVEDSVAQQVRTFKSENGIIGVHIENDSKRYYPYSTLASNVIGFVGTENKGLEGLEAVYDDYLQGTDGSVVRLTTARGIDLLYTNYENYNDAVDGCDLELTLSVPIQSIAEKYLQQAVRDYDAQNGCAIVMNVNTGEILALACANDYDLNSPWDVSEAVQERLDLIEDEQERSAALRDARLAQWRNFAISDTYEPGSVFKIITMSMALEEGIIDTDDTFYCSGTMPVLGRTELLHCWKSAGHGTQTIKEAAQHSCNTAFAQIGIKVGGELFYDYVEAFGFWNKTGIDLPGEASTRGLWWSEKVFCDKNNLSQLASASFGQTFNVTPIQIITAVSAVANGGNLMEPYIVSRITAPDGEVVYSKEPTVVRSVISRETSDLVCSILESVVGEPEGTGKTAYVAGYHIAGKTGTTTKTAKEAATGVREYMVSFCGFAPANDPEIACLFVLDNPRNKNVYTSGGVMAAPSVGGILSESLGSMGIEPELGLDETGSTDVNVPKLTGMSLEGAEAVLEGLGLEYRVLGGGVKVTDQLPAPGYEVAEGSKIVIYTEGAKTEEMTTMPNLTGLTVSQARSALANAGLYMDTSGASPSNSKVVVSRQSVVGGDEVPKGTVIGVTLIDPSDNGRY